MLHLLRLRAHRPRPALGYPFLRELNEVPRASVARGGAAGPRSGGAARAPGQDDRRRRARPRLGRRRDAGGRRRADPPGAGGRPFGAARGRSGLRDEVPRRGLAFRKLQAMVEGARLASMADRPVTRIAQAYPDRVEVGPRPRRRPDGTGDVHRVLPPAAHRRGADRGQRFFLDLLLVSIAEHGMMPTNVAARMTLAADPDSLQGAVAPGSSGRGRSCSAPPRSARGSWRRRRLRAKARARWLGTSAKRGEGAGFRSSRPQARRSAGGAHPRARAGA